MKTKQLLSLFLAAAMVLALCACGARPAAPGAMASEAPEPSQSTQTEEMMITDMIGRLCPAVMREWSASEPERCACTAT